MIADISSVVTLIAILSVGTERVVEILKPALPTAIFNSTIVYSTTAIFVAAALYILNGTMLPLLSSNLYIQAAIVGLACSAGSGFWNNLLSVLKDLKK
jgi:hypothetical protein